VEEGRRMDWVLGEVAKIHGSQGPNPLFPNPLDCQNPDGNMPASPLPPAGGEVPALPVPKNLTPGLPGASIPEVGKPPVPGSTIPAAPVVPAKPAPSTPEIPPAVDQDGQQAMRKPIGPAAPVVANGAGNGPKTFVLPSINKDGPSPLAAMANQARGIQTVGAQQGNGPAVVIPANNAVRPQQGR